jgi:hypothetical protein
LVSFRGGGFALTLLRSNASPPSSLVTRPGTRTRHEREAFRPEIDEMARVATKCAESKLQASYLAKVRRKTANSSG